MVLRTLVTLQLSAIIGQAGWAAAALGGEERYWRFHEIGSWVTGVISLVSMAAYVVLKRSAGTVNLALAILLGLAVGVQFLLGENALVAEHIFLGVLIAMLATALTSWTYRHNDAVTPNGRIG